MWTDALVNNESATTLEIGQITALEILDSRGNPTVRVKARISDGTAADASVPSGASTGENEAMERRDGDAQRYRGKGGRHAVEKLNREIAPAASSARNLGISS